MRRIRLVPFLLLFVPFPRDSSLQAQGSPPRAAPCASPEQHQFDFWIGDWNVKLPDGRLAGVNVIEPILGGCVLRESWTGAGGMSGTSYNIYDRTRQVWHQTWVDGQGNLLTLEGKFASNRMILEGVKRDSTGGTVLNRITWEPTAPDQLRQIWQTSGDGGTTWTTAFDGRYTRR
jgi:hypothetical protein